MSSTGSAIALTIAGSDSGGGAGIQADLKTFAALGVYGMSVLTAITAQNTQAVTAVTEIPSDVIAAQIDAVLADIGADAVKTGMLSSAAIIETVADRLRAHQVARLVVDPVMVAKSGDHLLRTDAVDTLRSVLIPMASVVTPNLPEAEVLLGHPVERLSQMREAARALLDMGPNSVVVKGGHLQGDANDVFYDGTDWLELRADRVLTTSTHGTGCTFASAIAANLALGHDLAVSVRNAKTYLTEAIAHAYPIGHGHGPVHH
ncbi:MAG TPA: bifunctional hydroxymethylpyrimidine kinase/phosphomethylpyrimidine kinase, partial [Chloroflexota bacterium]|nr:bifunctional hydroxymethylpyrimidine kinase/phosphomethylpyrimidine kinase [Chloroflexota bacterium]